MKEISESILNKAASYKIEDYIPLFQKDAPSEEKVKNTKLVLAQKKPVIVGMRVLQNFYNIRPGDESWFPTLGNTGYAGGHAMVVVGYDDERFSRPGQEISAEMRGGFKLMNSWGKNWGENGFIWIRYAHFGEFCRHAYAIMLADGPPIDFNLDMTTEAVKAEERTQEQEGEQLNPMAGSFGFRQYMGKSSEGYHVFEEAGVRLDDNFYTLEGSQKAGDIFQLYVQSGFENGYIYVFSVDPLGKAEVHFPKSQEYIESFEGEEESAMLVSGGSVLTIPAVDSGLRFTHPGKDHLIVLFSTQKVRPKYLEYLCTQLSSNKKNLKTHLFQLLEKYMIPLADITYQQETMGFEVSTRSDGKIVPILLTVSVH
ncbi:MAG: DUF4384 domain-containing protein [Saprospiraceae bacterium]|nr:DUF4384 domain-containing protein [Saprospiraceae bacterium]